MKQLVYIHGFNSSPKSEKAALTKGWFSSSSSDFQVYIAEFPAEPKSAIESICAQVEALGTENVAGFIGSSLGGYYSVYLQDKYDKPAVLINPALKPYLLLSDYIGPQTNPYTGERYQVLPEHMDQLREIERVSEVNPSDLFVLTQSGDEVLDYQEALGLLSGAKAWIQYGGNHAFEGFQCTLPAIQSFFERR